MAFDPSTFREESLDTWRGVAAGWEERRDWLTQTTAKVNDWLVAKADPEPGQTVLEIAAGTGDLGFAAARRVGSEGKLISTDFAPEMVDVARRAGEAMGLTWSEHRVMDAEALELGDASVDAALCRWAFMLMADPATAFGETRRVLRGGGRLAFAVWTAPDRNPWASLPAMTLVRLGHMPPPDPELPGIFAFGDPRSFTPMLTANGFTEFEIEEVTFDFIHPDFEDAWITLRKLTGPLAHVLDSLPAEDLKDTHGAVEAALRPYRQDDGSYSIPASTWAVVAS